MRISNNTIFNPFQRNLEDIQTRKFEEEIRLTSGQRIINVSDDPKALVNIKQLTTMINRNEVYQNNIETALGEMRMIDEQIYSIQDNLQEVRQRAIEADQTGNAGALPSLAEYIKGLLEDLVRDANLDFNGHYVFSGTLTNDESLGGTPPFEIIEGESTEDNPSGLSVVFHGNNKDRKINKDENTQEVINTKAVDLFGENGTKVFEPIIDLYNLLQYSSDGGEREPSEVLNKDESALLSGYQAAIADQVYYLNNTAGKNGAGMNRLTAIQSQLENENLRLKDYRSVEEDTDYAETTLNLKKDEIALQYTLQIGGKLMQNSLFDFIA